MIGIWLGIGVFVLVLAMAMMFSFGEAVPHASTAEPSPVMVELETLKLQAELIMNAIENDFRARQLTHEAEGARQMRVAIRAHLENLSGGEQ